MNKILFHKVLSIFAMTILMAIALSYVNSLILERKSRQQEVMSNIAHSSAGKQTLIGPVLVVPYTESYPQTFIENENAPDQRVKVVMQHEEKVAYFLPEALNIHGGFTNQYKTVSLYHALMYELGGSLDGHFKLPKDLNLVASHPNTTFTIHNAHLSVGISDTRGIRGKPMFMWDQQTLEFQQGSQLVGLGNGIHVDILDLTLGDTREIPFKMQLNLNGMESLDIVPIANINQIALHSSWPSPQFNGSFLPDTASQKISANGFEAHWAVSSLASNVQDKLFTQLNNHAPQVLEALSVGFVEPINIYSQSDRATKYGLLFIGLTFAGFFLFEILKQLPIHPAQYTLVGLAMALFYLLLISLSEHVSFLTSYVTATMACVSLLGYYLTYVLKSRLHGLLFGGSLTLLYGALYGILASEDNALLMGSLLVFSLVALAMITTRRVDWYRINISSEKITL